MRRERMPAACGAARAWRLALKAGLPPYDWATALGLGCALWLGCAVGRGRSNDMACIGALRAQKYRIHCFHLPVMGLPFIPQGLLPAAPTE